MSVLKKRSTAALIAAVVIILGTLFGVHRSIAAQTQQIESMFNDGIYLADEAYLQPSIREQLDERAFSALGLVTIANHYDGLDEQADAVRQARNMLLDTDSIAAKYEANIRLQTAVETLYAAMTAQGIGADDTDAADAYAYTFNGAQGVIDHSAYNYVVAEFRDELSAFPVNAIKILAFVRVPEYFGPED